MDKRFFFEKYGLSERDLEKYLGAALGAGGEYADLYFEYLTSTALSLDESMVKSASQGISAGCGVRVVTGERTGYAYTDDLAPEKILHAARTAALIASRSGEDSGGEPEGQGTPQSLSGERCGIRRRAVEKGGAGLPRRQGRARLRSAHQGSSRQLCRRASPHPGDRLRWHLCRRRAAVVAHERLRHCARRRS